MNAKLAILLGQFPLWRQIIHDVYYGYNCDIGTNLYVWLDIYPWKTSSCKTVFYGLSPIENFYLQKKHCVYHLSSIIYHCCHHVTLELVISTPPIVEIIGHACLSCIILPPHGDLQFGLSNIYFMKFQQTIIQIYILTIFNEIQKQFIRLV